MGNDDPRLRWHRLHGVSSEGKASIDGRLIDDQWAMSAAFGGFFLLPNRPSPQWNRNGAFPATFFLARLAAMELERVVLEEI
jgi:hypothetical protein